MGKCDICGKPSKSSCVIEACAGHLYDERYRAAMFWAKQPLQSDDTKQEHKDTVLHAPSAHTLVECLRELKFGRPGEEQRVLDELINVAVSRLGNDGPGWPPEVIDQVFDS